MKMSTHETRRRLPVRMLRALRGGRIRFQHPVAFWLGTAAITAGTLLHLPMFMMGADMGYKLRGMPMDTAMKAGMVLIIGGLAAATYALFPRVSDSAHRTVASLRVKALDDTPLRFTHVALLFVMGLAVMIDIIKPTTLGFVLPGITEEYGLKSPANPGGLPPGLLPLMGITGTTIGSFLWGYLADRMGRRSAILLAALMFIATSVCGAMPGFGWNLLMCFIMGLSAGGMLPITYALLAETIPAKHRGLLMILIGGDLSGAFFLTSWLSSTLQPHYGWRIMWLIGAPTGMLLILLNRWIPESPRFLLATGRTEEAHEVMDRFGVVVTEDDAEPEADAPWAADAAIEGRFRQLLRSPFTGLSAGLALYGLAYGLVQFGFLLWLPTNLRNAGLEGVTADGLVAKASLIGFPVTFLVALLYGVWSSKKTMVIFAGLTSLTLVAFIALGEDVLRHPVLLEAFVVIVIMGVSTATTDLMPTYASEVYPTRLRGRGTGLVAGASKAGGILGIGLVVAAVAPPSFTGAAVLGAIPTGLAAITLGRFGVETRRRRLEDITAQEFAPELT